VAWPGERSVLDEGGGLNREFVSAHLDKPQDIDQVDLINQL
jgi:hypothetical protein